MQLDTDPYMIHFPCLAATAAPPPPPGARTPPLPPEPRLPASTPPPFLSRTDARAAIAPGAAPAHGPALPLVPTLCRPRKAVAAARGVFLGEAGRTPPPAPRRFRVTTPFPLAGYLEKESNQRASSARPGFYAYLWPLLAVLLVAMGGAGAAPNARAATFTLSTGTSQFTAGVNNQGWWTGATSTSNYDSNDNYFVGFSAGDEHRNFFTFNLAGVTGNVVSATLQLDRGTSAGSSATFNLFDVSTPAATLNYNVGFSAPIFNDLGGGVSYGSFVFTNSAQSDPALLSLNAAALTALTAAEGGYFSLGGTLTNNSQFLFGGTEGRAQTLILQTGTIPEPTTWAMALGGLGVLVLLQRRGRAGRRRGFALAAGTVLAIGGAGALHASIVNEVEGNDTRASATFIPSTSFQLNTNPNVYYNLPTATLQGTMSTGNDVDFWRFTGIGGTQVFFDVDNNPTNFDSVLSLFNANGTLLAYCDDAGGDPGSPSGLDAFIGVYTLPATGDYYLAVTSYPNFPSTVINGSATASTNLLKPDGNYGGTAVTGATVGLDTFPNTNASGGTGAYRVEFTMGVVPEPSTWAMALGGLGVLVLLQRRGGDGRRRAGAGSLALTVLWVLSPPAARAATVLPVGPITFSLNADYDGKFNENPSFNGAFRNPAGYVELPAGAGSSALAVYDASATGGSGGSGGSGGGHVNNDLANNSLRADFTQNDISGGRNQGFLLRLDNFQGNGYLATFSLVNATQVRFRLFEGAGFNSGGTVIFDQTVFSALTAAADTFYPFGVTANGATFSFDFGAGAATAAFTDATLTATVGQAGFLLGGGGRLDNFAIANPVPEPSTWALSAVGLTGLAGVARHRRRRTSRRA